ncbi:hypothetical protein LCGC14_1408800 [marine sediment metagenome]|uniref:Uncharacterized protein n=1 Tax=marine sediment metagenome TaxID=412755 RepID=A0A0F9MA82_9ZZZZ
MKVTVNKKDLPYPKPIRWQDLPGGTVVKFNTGFIGMVYEGAGLGYEKKEKGVVLLEWVSVPTIGFGILTVKITEVLGTLTEIIVEEK